MGNVEREGKGGSGRGVYHVKMSKNNAKNVKEKTKMSKKEICKKILRIVNNSRLGHLPETENSLQIQK